MQRIFLLIAAFLFLVGCAGSETTKLELLLEDGYEQVYVFETSTTANQMGTMEDISEIKFTLKETLANGNYLLTGEIIRMKYSSTMFGETENYDSDDEIGLFSGTEMELYQEGLDLLNRPFSLTINKRGEIIEDAAFIDGRMSLLTISDFTNCPVIFPEEPVSVGFSWTIDSDNPVADMLKIHTTYTVKEMKEAEIILDVNMEMDAIFDGDHTAVGTYTIDRKTGQFISGDRTMNMQTGGGTATYKISRK